MKKIKITERQAKILGIKKGTKSLKEDKISVVKITKEQYNRIFASGLIKENNVNRVEPEAIASDGFKNEIIELVKFLYRENKDLSPYWEQHGLSYDEICKVLTSKNILISKNGKHEISKSLGSPEQALSTLESTLKSLIGEDEEIETEAVNVPYGAENDSNAPVNQETNYSKPTIPNSEPLKVILYNREMAILKGADGSYYAFFYDSVDRNDFAQYAEREETLVGKDDTGDPDIEFGDFEINNDVIQGYVNDNLVNLSKGEGLQAWEQGIDIVRIDSELKQELISMYDKNKQISNILGSIQENSDEFSQAFEPTKQAFVKSPEAQTPEKANILAKLKSNRKGEEDRRNAEKDTPSEFEIDETTTAASSGSFTPPLGMTRGKLDTGVPVVRETTTQSAGNYQYDANALPGINRDGSFKETKQTKAQKNTQWAGGSFVDFNDCTKLNNKVAGTGCSQGGVDNVVKLKKSSGNINAPSLKSGK